MGLFYQSGDRNAHRCRSLDLGLDLNFSFTVGKMSSLCLMVVGVLFMLIDKDEYDCWDKIGDPVLHIQVNWDSCMRS